MSYSPEVLRLVEERWQDWEASFGSMGPGARKAMLEMLSEQRALEALDLVAANVPYSLTGRRLLEIGCGVGTTLLVARRRGILAVGIEPSFLGARAASHLLGEQGAGNAVACGVGETLPFPDGTFDVVCFFQVIEHVREPEAVLEETIRVLRPGGCFVHVFPNYGSFWEGHYGIPWIPHLPKSLGRLYIRMLGRDTRMLEELQLLSHAQVARMLARHRCVRVTNWGVDLWERRLRTLDFSEWAYLGRVRRAVRLLHRLHLVEPLVAAGRALHFETPIVLTGTKL